MNHSTEIQNKELPNGRFLGIIFALFILIYYFIAPAYSAGGFNHNQAARRKDCLSCHVTPPPSTRTESGLQMRSGAGDWCLSCHSNSAQSLHPMNIPAPKSFGLPLEVGKISCLTCHSPHVDSIASTPYVSAAQEVSSTGGYSTNLLIVRNVQGELCHRCHSPDESFTTGAIHKARSFSARSFAGSKSCAGCHADIFKEWQKTPHARMTRVLPKVNKLKHLTSKDFEWPKEEIAYVLGSHYVNRLVAKASGTLVVLPAIFDRQTHKALPVRDYGWKRRFWLKQ